MLCYEALFGYWLEFFPLGNLHPGPVMAMSGGRYNLKNPACYIWPDENNCNPGDHFKQGDEAAVAAFVNYKPFPFEMPLVQSTANWINGVCLLVVTLFIGGYLLKALFNRWPGPRLK